MKAHNYLFRISCLELYYPVIINDDICIIPNSFNMRDDFEINLSYIDFNPSSFSYLLIMSEKPIKREKLENLTKKVISMITILILNPLYLEEFYHFKYEGGILSLGEATIKPFEAPDLRKKRNHLHGSLQIYSFNKIAGDLFKKISNNPISDSLYLIIMEYIASHRERFIDISGPIAWNVLEHIASRYWKNLGRHKRTYIKTKIFKMFEKETIEYESKKELIKNMYTIRNKIYHEGLSLPEIENVLGKNPINVIMSFKPFLYRKILEFLGFIDEFFLFYSGHLIIKKDSEVIPNILEWEPDIKTKLDEYELVQKIKSLDDLLPKLMGTVLDTEVKDENKHYKVHATLSMNNGEYIITFLDFPRIFLSAFDELPSKDQKYPEEIIRYLRPITCTFINNDIRYEIEFYNRPIDYPKFDMKISQPEIEKWIKEQTGKERKIKELISKINFEINKITMKKIL